MRGARVCPSCAAPHPAGDDFCRRCGMPLVHAERAAEAVPALSPAAERARKVRPEYTRGELVRVAGGRNQAEAEMIQNLLLEEGIPSLLRRSAGFDVPDFLAAGPRDVLVPESGSPVARELLTDAGLAPSSGPAGASGGSPGSGPRAGRLLAVLVVGALAAALIAWLMLRATALG